jgi:hypothetical protein
MRGSPTDSVIPHGRPRSHTCWQVSYLPTGAPSPPKTIDESLAWIPSNGGLVAGTTSANTARVCCLALARYRLALYLSATTQGSTLLKQILLFYDLEPIPMQHTNSLFKAFDGFLQ